ncbi:hypothetical protein OHB26_19990 [Nocardia sp. NBC_01503]|uniref:hypothetical protein n=1 Tax=Nocardia sp. NBC_01503 TaxID=2975997 RepID=UPI002E7B4DA4|nr:hypothetical protein [Nocardia sp. NBC_01503]WTL29297.1 hypothetical protein OHB26_19990 [Nocardia sp. NBC_01503]
MANSHISQPGAVGRGVRTLSMWPWVASLAAAAVVDLVIGAVRRFDFHGINGFSTTNYGWLAFTLVGGVGFAWRLAGTPLTPLRVMRPLVAPAVAFALCFVAVTITGLVFLPNQSLSETLTTDAPGRALTVGEVVLVFGVLAEVLRAAARARR